MKAASVAKRLLRSVGLVNGVPRITNIDTGNLTIGYTEVNTQATTAFSRTKMHKAWFEGTTDIADGSRVQDVVDGHRYIVMSLKREYSDGEIAFVNGTLMFVNTTCTIGRISNNVDAFGRTTDTTFTPVATGIWTMVNPMSDTPLEYPDVESEKTKIKIAMQGSVDVRVQDRLTTDTGEMFKVEALSRSELVDIVMLYVSPDVR